MHNFYLFIKFNIKKIPILRYCINAVKDNFLFRAFVLKIEYQFRNRFQEIDTEGYEFKVVQGLRETIKKNFPILLIEIEKNQTTQKLKFASEINDWKKEAKTYNKYICNFWLVHPHSRLSSELQRFIS